MTPMSIHSPGKIVPSDSIFGKQKNRVTRFVSIIKKFTSSWPSVNWEPPEERRPG